MVSRWNQSICFNRIRRRSARTRSFGSARTCQLARQEVSGRECEIQGRRVGEIGCVACRFDHVPYRAHDILTGGTVLSVNVEEHTCSGWVGNTSIGAERCGVRCEDRVRHVSRSGDRFVKTGEYLGEFREVCRGCSGGSW